MSETRVIPDKIHRLEKSWYRLFHRWWIIHYISGISSTFSAITVASRPSFLESIPHAIEIFSWVAAVSIAMITFLVPPRRAKAYKEAWRILYKATTTYSVDNATPESLLVDALDQGEAIIAAADPM